MLISFRSINRLISLILLSISASIVLSSCSSSKLTPSETARYYELQSVIESINSNIDVDKYSKLIEGIITFSYNRSEFERLVKENSVSDSGDSLITSDYLSYLEGISISYSEPAHETPSLEVPDEKRYATPEQQAYIDTLSERDNLANKNIGYWLNAIPLDEIDKVLDAYDNGELTLDKENGTYTIGSSSNLEGNIETITVHSEIKDYNIYNGVIKVNASIITTKTNSIYTDNDTTEVVGKSYFVEINERGEVERIYGI